MHQVSYPLSHLPARNALLDGDLLVSIGLQHLYLSNWRSQPDRFLLLELYLILSTKHFLPGVPDLGKQDSECIWKAASLGMKYTSSL